MSTERYGSDELLQDIARWRVVAAARAPSYHALFAELVALLEEDTGEAADLAARLHDAWASRSFRIFYERPLLLLAALRMEALTAGPAHPLWPALAAPRPDPRSATRAALLDALSDASVWHSLRTRFVQTNETSRAVAWLWPAQIIGCDGGQRPLALVEVGAAAGLNLVADRLQSPWVTSSGAALSTVRAPHVVARLGIDARPLDACSDLDTNWLRACVWAGEHERIARLEAAVAAFRASPVQLERGDVTEVPARLRSLSERQDGNSVVLAFQTIVRDYLDDQARGAYEQGMKRWLEVAPVGRALWIELEIEHPTKAVPIVAHARDGGGIVDLALGKTSYHPAAVAVDDATATRLADIFG